LAVHSEPAISPSETIAKIRIDFRPPGSLPAGARTENARKRGHFRGRNVKIS
jgi:hypothetical protein